MNNDPSWASFVNYVQKTAKGEASEGLPAADIHLPYAGFYPNQVVNGQEVAGDLLMSECDLQSTGVEPAGVDYIGQTDINGIGVKDLPIDTDSVAGILRVNSTQSFYPDSGTPTQWGAQLNVVVPNVTILGQKCKAPVAGVCGNAAGSSSYSFWLQNVVSYDSFNDTISFVDDTWNFTTGSSGNGGNGMADSSLLSWSPNGGNYTGVWVAFSPYIYCPPPFTATAYINTSVNAAGDQIFWYNYSVQSNGHFYANGNYDYLVFKSQPKTGSVALTAPYIEASTISHSVREGYEFDAFIGADDGSNQMNLLANATMQVQYCSLAPSNLCTPTHFAYANVPAAINYGEQTGEQTSGIAVNYIGTTAYMSTGPLIEHGLWNYSGQTGVAAGNTKVINDIVVSGAPNGPANGAPVSAQPYVFVFFANTAYASAGYNWAPDNPAWFLMPGTYKYYIQLSDYTQQNGTLTVGGSTVTLSATLPYAPANGVYTPLFALNNTQLLGITTSGSGTIGSQYALFNNPTTGAYGHVANNVTTNYSISDDYHFPAFPGLLLDNTTAYVDANALPTFGVSASNFLQLELFKTQHVTISHDAALRGWSSMEEISFYITVPASQNPAPQAELFVWNSTGDLIMDNNFIATKPSSSSYVANDNLVLYGGTNNVVWGNNFRNPPGVALGSSYAGIALAESGDLIYNNNFTVDNPVVYLPYNFANTADCLPQTLGGCANQANHNGWYYNTQLTETWNVSLQSASNVVHTVNGFPLSGNVLGASVTTQGGNYFWNYGTSPNNQSTSPYVSRFYYSDWSNIFPLGCGSIQAKGAPCGTAPAVTGAYENGIQVGGDYVPYGPTVMFSETGLASAWAVTLNGKLYTTSSTTLAIPVAYGTYSYSISSLVAGYTITPATGSVTVNGVPTVHVTFTPAAAPTYSVYFTESGLPTGTSWSVTLGGTLLTSTSATITFSGESAGAISYTISGGAGYTPTPASGSVTVTSVSVSVGVTFKLNTDTVTFTESGLTGGTLWAVTFGGVIHWSTSTTISFAVAPGTYAFQVGVPPGYTLSSVAPTSPVTVSGATPITVTFSP